MKKNIFVLCVIFLGIMLCACQPTPENAAVAEKNNNELNQLIEETNTASTDYNFPASVTETAQSTNLSVIIDASVEMPDTTSYPVKKATIMDFTQEQADLILNELVGDAQLISLQGQDSATMTKEDIIKRIGELQTMLQDTDDDPTQKESIKSEITQLQEQLDTAPVESEVEYVDRNFNRQVYSDAGNIIITDEEKAGMTEEELELLEKEIEEAQSNSGQTADVQTIEGACDLGKDTYATISIYKYDNPIYSYIRFVNQNSDESVMVNAEEMIQEISLDSQINNLEISCQDAYQQALDVLSNMGINGIDLVKTAKVPMGSTTTNQSEWPYCYMFVFSRTINGISYTYALEEKTSQEQVSEVWPQEYIKIYIDDSGIIQFDWEAPTQIGETVNENVSLESFDEIMDTFKQQITNQYAYKDDSQITAQEIHIEKITLGMMKIKMADDSGYMFVPVWDFFGYSINTYTDNTQFILDGNNKKTIDQFGKSFLTVNAIDGSIIDRGLGY